MENDPRFDVQRHSPLTPEGHIESLGHFSRGLTKKVGQQRISRLIGLVAFGVAVLAVIAIVQGN